MSLVSRTSTVRCDVCGVQATLVHEIEKEANADYAYDRAYDKAGGSVGWGGGSSASQSPESVALPCNPIAPRRSDTTPHQVYNLSVSRKELPMFELKPVHGVLLYVLGVMAKMRPAPEIEQRLLFEEYEGISSVEDAVDWQATLTRAGHDAAPLPALLQLEEHGYVDRLHGDLVRLTERGQEIAGSFMTAVLGNVEAAFRELDEEEIPSADREQLVEGLAVALEAVLLKLLNVKGRVPIDQVLDAKDWHGDRIDPAYVRLAVRGATMKKNGQLKTSLDDGKLFVELTSVGLKLATCLRDVRLGPKSKSDRQD